ncbi:MAG: phosphoribosyltransferase [Flavobacteriales bacterium]|nr:phosphoribosyltransferase [Flavobacteriales bacterium]
MPRSATKILDEKQVQQKINRMAIEIYEDNFEEQGVLIAGIRDNGYVLAERLAKALRSMSPLKVDLIDVTMDKDNPIQYEIELPVDDQSLKNKVVILVDDVVNSGRTLMYGSRRFLRQPIKKLRTAVLVNRTHRRFPIEANFVGLSLSTTLKEHVDVSLKNGEEGVFLK